MLSKEQIEFVKKQLLSQIDSLPESQRYSMKEQIESMSDQELEEFLIKNNLIKVGENQNNSNTSGGGCTFCLLVSGTLPSNKIAENEKAIAILEINPISKGHVIIIPKEHVNSKELKPKSLESFTKEISESIKPKLKAEKIEIIPSELFGHIILNLIPLYNKETLDLDAKRYKASEKELSELKSLLEIKHTENKESEKEIEQGKKKNTKTAKVKKEKSSESKTKKKALEIKKPEKEDLSHLPKAPRRIP